MDELFDWLRLAHTPGVGCRSAALLLRKHGSPAAVFGASDAALAADLGAQQIRSLRAAPGRELDRIVARTRAWLDEPGHMLLTLADAAYPALLAEIADPPLLLYAAGRTELLAGAALAVVGSRNASHQGKLDAQAFARALSQAGVTVVSGLALGIDTAAHEGALGGAGSTVAVLGTGLDHIYPLRNQALAARIAAHGCLVSEYAPGTPPLSANFPRRNRIISALAVGVLVVEAAARSGSLITARLAAEQGRDVFALPGSIHSALAKGCHRLIRDGAQLVESADEILLALARHPLLHAAAAHDVVPAPVWTAPAGAAPARAAPVSKVTPAQQAVLDALGHAPLTPDELQSRIGGAMGALGAELLALELAGLLARLTDGRVQRVVHAMQR